jgi:hypothetical protein
VPVLAFADLISCADCGRVIERAEWQAALRRQLTIRALEHKLLNIDPYAGLAS